MARECQHRITDRTRLIRVISRSPGTGKTTTLAEAILQLHRNNTNVRILVCAPSNSAADTIAMKLTRLGKSSLLRLNSPTREWHRLASSWRIDSEDLESFHEEFSLTVEVEEERDDKLVKTRRFRHPTKEEVETYNVVVATCVSGGMFAGLGVPRGYFDYIFIDEAAQVAEPQGS